MRILRLGLAGRRLMDDESCNSQALIASLFQTKREETLDLLILGFQLAGVHVYIRKRITRVSLPVLMVKTVARLTHLAEIPSLHDQKNMHIERT